MSFRLHPLIFGLIVVSQGCSPPLLAQETAQPEGVGQTEAVAAQAGAAATDTTVDVPPFGRAERSRRFDRNDNAVVTFGGDATLPAGESSDAVVAILGSASSAGDVDESVVSILGNTSVTGKVGESAVAILGNVYVNGRVDEHVVAILGDVELGPEARVGNDVVVIGGVLKRDPAAQIQGRIENVATGFHLGNVDWLDAWIENCLFYVRPLAIAPGLGWAWTVAFAFLALYVALALLFRSSTEKCLQTLETFPGRSLLAAFLGVLMTPIVFMLLLITVVGIAVIPFLAMALFFAGLFGKMVMLAWLGRRGTRFFGDGPFSHPAAAVLLGGVVILGVYLIPVVGFIVYKLLGVLGLGVVIYTLLLAWQNEHPPVAMARGAGVATPSAAKNNRDTIAPSSDLGFEGPTASPAAAAQRSTVDDATLPRAGFWIRMAALFIDTMLLGIILAVIDSSGSAILLVLAAYGAVMWKYKSTTIGGSICGLKVVRLDGRPIDWSTAVVRALSCFLSLAIAFLGFIWVVFDREKQSWHDKIAGTTIVRVPKGVSLL